MTTFDDVASTFGTSPLSSEQKYTRRKVLKAAVIVGAAASLGPYLGACGGTNPSGATSTAASTTVRRGGTLRVGLTGGASADSPATLNPASFEVRAMQFSMYEQLTSIADDGSLQMELAEEMTANSDATEWTVRLRDGVTFQNGKDLTADDLKYTLETIMDPKNAAGGVLVLRGLDVAGIKKLDKLTLRLPFKQPYSYFPQVHNMGLINLWPTNFDPNHPVGTGPWQLVDWTPGQYYKYKRYPDYWQSGIPYADELILTNYSDETAQVNALLGGQEDIAGGISMASVANVKGQGQEVQSAPGGAFTPFCMRVDVPPFNDVRVRQAMRLIVDRKQMLEVVFGGNGSVGNDMASPYDPVYDHQLSQREQDISQAKSLLKAAGQEGMTVELVTADVYPGVVASAQVIAQQAKAAGVTINVRKDTVSDFYGPKYLSFPFCQDYFGNTLYLPMVATALVPGGPWNETHWGDARYLKLFAEASASTDDAKRSEICREMEAIDFNEGGYIIPYFPAAIDAYSPHVHGMSKGVSGNPINDFNTRKIWLS